MRKNKTFQINAEFPIKALYFASQFDPVTYLNPNHYSYPYGAFKHVLAWGAQKEFNTNEKSIESLTKFIEHESDYLFGYFSYDFKNELESLTSKNPTTISFDSVYFFIPKNILIYEGSQVIISTTENPDEIYNSINSFQINKASISVSSIPLKQRFSKEEYVKRVNLIQDLIKRGDIYEVNFCQEYYIENIHVSPVDLYEQLNLISPMPFSCFVKHKDNYLVCSSPERFIKKENNKVISQPIKGTAKRGNSDHEDWQVIEALKANPKEKAENIMIVDLVRNDLSKTAVAGTVKAEEICSLHSFPNVHQLISTVVSEPDKQFSSLEIISKAFPMGSMTGAPKIKAMEIIDEFEAVSRGLFSGSVGYFTPDKNFDFNVVIRSFLYNAQNHYLSFQAGSAITYYSDAEEEYRECEVKVKGMKQALRLITTLS